LAEEEWVPEEDLTRLRSKYEDKIAALTTRKDDNGVADERDGDRPAARRRLHQELLKAERNAIIHLRDQGRIDDEVQRQVERELDLEEQRFQADL